MFESIQVIMDEIDTYDDMATLVFKQPHAEYLTDLFESLVSLSLSPEGRNDA